MHSDGYIVDILDDLAEIGVNAINAQLDCMDVFELGERFSGKISFWGGFGRQYFLPFGSETEVRAEVRKIADGLLAKRRTGVIGGCNIDKDARPENITAMYDEWRKV